MAGLDDLEIARPCDADWDGMRGDDRSRLCDRCRREVVDLAAHTRAEAEAIAAQDPATRPCLLIARDARGRVVTRRDVRLPLALAAGVLTATSGGLVAAAGAAAHAERPAGPVVYYARVRSGGLVPLHRGEWLAPDEPIVIPTFTLGVGK